MNSITAFFTRCCRKVKRDQLSPEERISIAKARWRKVWVLRDLLMTINQAKQSAEDFNATAYEGISVEYGDELKIKPKNWIVYPWDYWKKGWDLLIGSIKIYYCFVIPYYLAFGIYYQSGVIPLDTCFDILLFFDIFIRMSSAYLQHSKLIVNRVAILNKSIREGLVIDLICVLPLYSIHSGLMWLRVLRLLQIGQLKTAMYNANIVDKLLYLLSFRDYNSKQAFLRVANFVILFCIIVHNITCYFYLLAKNENIKIDTTYLANSYLNNEQIYVKTLYFVITTISTVGYGDISPKTSKEIAFVIFIQFLGVVVFAFLTGNMTSILMNLKKRELQLSSNEVNLDKWFFDLNVHHKFRIPNDLQQSIKGYFMYHWKNNHSALLTETDFLMRMPVELRHHLIKSLFKSDIKKFSVFFKDFSESLTYAIMLEFNPRFFEANQPLIKCASEVDEVFLIRHGEVLLTSRLSISFLKLSQRSFIGEEYILFNKQPKFNYIASSTGVECFCINKSKYLELLNKHPKSFKTALQRSFKRERYFKAVMKDSLNPEDISSNVIFTSRSPSLEIKNRRKYLDQFTWDLDNEEISKLNYLIQKNNEITSKEKIITNIIKSSNSLNTVNESVITIHTKANLIKHYYERDVNNLVNVIKLFRAQRIDEAEKEIKALCLEIR